MPNAPRTRWPPAASWNATSFRCQSVRTSAPPRVAATTPCTKSSSDVCTTLMLMWGRLTAEVAATLTPILLLVRSAAASDANMAELQEQSSAERLERMQHNARFLQERGYLREDVCFDEAVDVMWLHSSPELYELLVLQRGWSTERFARYVAESMAGALVHRAPPSP